jgi:hypothetical protein
MSLVDGCGVTERLGRPSASSTSRAYRTHDTNAGHAGPLLPHDALSSSPQSASSCETCGPSFVGRDLDYRSQLSSSPAGRSLSEDDGDTSSLSPSVHALSRQTERPLSPAAPPAAPGGDARPALVSSPFWTSGSSMVGGEREYRDQLFGSHTPGPSPSEDDRDSSISPSIRAHVRRRRQHSPCTSAVPAPASSDDHLDTSPAGCGPPPSSSLHPTPTSSSSQTHACQPVLASESPFPAASIHSSDHQPDPPSDTDGDDRRPTSAGHDNASIPGHQSPRDIQPLEPSPAPDQCVPSAAGSDDISACKMTVGVDHPSLDEPGLQQAGVPPAAAAPKGRKRKTKRKRGQDFKPKKRKRAGTTWPPIVTNEKGEDQVRALPLALAAPRSTFHSGSSANGSGVMPRCIARG